MISSESYPDIKEIFSFFDKEGKGQLPISQLGDCLRALGNAPSQAQIDKIISEFDSKNQGWLDFPTLLTIINEHSDAINIQVNKEDIIRVFKSFDKEGTGYISSEELKHILTTIGEKLSESEVDEIFSSIHAVKDGRVNYEEFVNTILSN